MLISIANEQLNTVTGGTDWKKVKQQAAEGGIVGGYAGLFGGGLIPGVGSLAGAGIGGAGGAALWGGREYLKQRRG